MRDGDGNAQQQRNQVGQHLLRGLGQRVEHAALAQQIAEHQKADQRHRRRARPIPRSMVTTIGNRIRVSLGDIVPGCTACGSAAPSSWSPALMAERLDDRHQRHVGVRRHDDRARGTCELKKFATKMRGGAVRRADDRRWRPRRAGQSPAAPADHDVKKMPNCAAAPKSSSLGFASSGPKSIIAPMPMNSSSGNSSLLDARVEQPCQRTGLSPRPPSPASPRRTLGRLTRIAPKPIGSSSAGSISFLIAR